MERKRYFWVDNVKIIAIFLVALGHMLMGLFEAGIFTNPKAFIDYIYYFHVPLFLLCSGFLYQRLTVEQDLKGYGKNLLKKLLSLGIPYFVFSGITIAFRIIFASEVNKGLSTGSLVNRFFVNPLSPYWYLYTLFLLFVISPILKFKADGIIRLVISVMLFMFYHIYGFGFLPRVPAAMLGYISDTYFWFLLGMNLAFFNLDKYFKKSGGLFFLLFTVLAVLAALFKIDFTGMTLILGTLACIGVVSFTGGFSYENGNPKVLDFLAKYTFPVFLMHTIFAAGIRVILLKIGITNLFVHIAAGLAASFVFPIIAAMIMEKIKFDFLYSPTKYIKIK